MRSAQEIWEAALGELQLQINKPNYQTWLQETEGIEFRDGHFYIGTPNTFVAEYLEKNQRSLIEKTLIGLVKSKVVAHFQVSSIQPEPTDGYAYRETPQAIDSQISDFNPKYTFESFVVGNSNQLAYAAAQSAAQNPGESYNPLFIYGGSGLGKTHLLQAIGHTLQARRASVLYVSGEQFTNEFIDAIRHRTTGEFRDKYRSVDALMVDDIQFISGKEQTEESFFHTFNELHNSNRQIIVTSDKLPQSMPGMEERLRSRFEWGLITDIQPPDLETRVAILRKKAQAENLNIPYDVLDYIANYIDSNIRELEGALIRMVAYATITNKPLNMDTAVEALKDILPPPRPKKITIELIQKEVSSYYGITLAELLSKKRTKQVAYPRQIAMYLCRKLTDASYPQIGEQFGGRDHTTVIHANEKVEKDLIENAELQSTIDMLTRKLDPNIQD